jgi:hypothetical protein
MNVTARLFLAFFGLTILFQPTQLFPSFYSFSLPTPFTILQLLRFQSLYTFFIFYNFYVTFAVLHFPQDFFRCYYIMSLSI